MKLHFLLSSFICLSFFSGKSQDVSSYSFTDTTKIYIPNPLGTLINGTWDNEYFQNRDIGFPFFYRGQLYTWLTVNCNGSVTLGENIQANSPTPLSDYNNTISVFGADIKNSDTTLFSAVRILTYGFAPERSCAIEFYNFAPVGSPNSTGNAIIRLYEADGRIEMHYGSFAANFPSVNAQVGIRGSSDFLNLTGDNWYAPTFGISISAFITASGTQPDSSIPGNGLLYTFLPANPVPDAPINLTFTNIGLTGLTINWDDNSTNEYNFAVYISSDSINFSYIGTTVPSVTTATTGTNYHQDITGLDIGTTYYFRVYALSDGGFSEPLEGSQATNSGTFPLNVTIGSGGDYQSITAAVGAINTLGLTGNTFVNLLPDYNSSYEPSFPVIIPFLPGSSTYSITIRPDSTATGLSIVSTAIQTIDLNGASRIIFDGRPGGMGTESHITIGNSNLSGNAIRFINDAVYDTIRFVVVQGVNNQSSGGVIHFSTTTGTKGNCYNSIENCDIKDGITTPTNLFYSLGSDSIINIGNSIINNNIYNFWDNAKDACGILLASNNNDYTIGRNRFYQTSPRTTATAAVTLTAIKIDNTVNGNKFLVDSNYIGGLDTMMIIGPSGTYVHKFCGIKLNTLSNLNPFGVYVNGNTITNIGINSTPGIFALAGTIFIGIELTGGNATIQNNIIGSATGTGSIIISFKGIVYDGALDAAGSILFNKTGGIRIQQSGNIGHSFYGIDMGNGINTLTGNIIGSLTTVNSIENLSSSSLGLDNNYGIYVSFGVNTISFNTIANITAISQSIFAVTGGINAGSLASVALIDDNFIYNISSGSTATSQTSPALAGIRANASIIPLTVSNNHIFNLYITNTSATGNFVAGLLFDGSKDIICSRNKIHSLVNQSSSSSAYMVGIANYADKLTCYNNMVRLGLDFNGNSLTTGNINIYGMYDKNAATLKNSYYFNTVYIAGTGIASGNSNSACFGRMSTSTDSLVCFDNIFVNGRSNAGAIGKHYAFQTNTITNVFTDYNLYYAPNAGGTLFGKTDAPSADYNTLLQWQDFTIVLDSNSIAADPLLLTPDNEYDTLSYTNLKLTNGSPAEGAGLEIPLITTDFENEIRLLNSPTDIGADAGDYCTIPDTMITPLSSTSFCQGGYVILQSDTGAGFTYQWMINQFPIQDSIGPQLTATITGDYMVMITNACNTTVFSDTITVTVYPVPATPSISQIGADSLMCDVTAQTYQWYLNGLILPDSTQIIIATQSGNYSVIAITNGCLSDTSEIYEFILFDVAKIIDEADIRVFPNPAGSTINIEFDLHGSLPVSVKLFNALGIEEKIVYENLYSDIHSVSFDLERLPAGLYYLVIEDGWSVLTKKIMIN
ncbi:MAG: T9SS type A sorting domain-containing protein [Bacteroidia bacterium]|nr:T9SS type A sorting domain-containing protein [Bacteroidia bacterium]